MSRRARRNHIPSFKAKGALAAVNGNHVTASNWRCRRMHVDADLPSGRMIQTEAKACRETGISCVRD